VIGTVDRLAGPDWRLVPAAAAVWLGTLLGLLVRWWLALVVGIVAAVVGLAVLVRSRGRRPRSKRWLRLGAGWALLVCGLAVALPTTLRLHRAEMDPLRPLAMRAASGMFQVELADRPSPVVSAGFGGSPGGVRSVVVHARVRQAVVTATPISSSGEVLLVAPVDGWAPLLPGQRIDLEAELAPAKSGAMTVAVLRVRGPPRVVSEAPPWQRAARALRSGLRDASRVLDPEPAGLIPALVVGDTDAVSPQVQDRFRTAGMAHLLAVSGANLAIVCVAVLLLLRAFRMGPRGSAVGAMVALVGFVVLAGPEPSVLRAAVMGAVGLLALVLGRERAALPALCGAVVLLVLYDPAMATSFGFALSVVATAGLVLLAPRWAGALAVRGLPRGLAEAFAVPAAAHLATAPVVAGMAGQVSMIAIVANVLAAPVVAPATVLGVLAAVLAPLSSWLAELMVRLAGPEVHWLIFVARQASRVPGAVLDWPDGWWGGLLLLVIVVVLLVALRHRRGRVLVGVAVALLLLVVIPVQVIVPGWPPTGWAMVSCDVGQGDAEVLSTAEPGRAVVVDTGPEPGPVGDCLDRLKVRSVPLVIISHLHADHIGGLTGVLAGRSVGGVAVGPARVPGWAWADVTGEASRAGVPVVQLDIGQRLAWPGLTIDVLGPRPAEASPRAEADGTDINNSSVVLRADTAAGRVLLTGDVELAAQADLLNAGVDLTADVLKVPHHGSRYSSPEFLDATRARIAVISVGAGNRYGHPSPLTIGFLDRRGTQVLRTDTSGDNAVVVSDTGPRSVSRGHPRAPP
jgi:competence protein ComEC